MIQPGILVSLAVLASLAGCIDNEPLDDASETQSPGEESETSVGDVSLAWEVDGTTTFDETVVATSGSINATLQNMDGLLTSYEVLQPSDCTNSMSALSFSMGGGTNDHTIECDASPGDEVRFEVRLTGAQAIGKFVIHEVQFES